MFVIAVDTYILGEKLTYFWNGSLNKFDATASVYVDKEKTNKVLESANFCLELNLTDFENVRVLTLKNNED